MKDDVILINVIGGILYIESDTLQKGVLPISHHNVGM